MFKKHWPKFIPIFVILFVLLAGIVYRGIFCAPMNKNIVSSFPHYSIKELDGQYYLRANQTDHGHLFSPDFDYGCYYEIPYFHSPEEMTRAIINGELTQEHIDYLYYVTSTVDRENDLYICDPVHMVKPVFGEEFTPVRLQWRGDWYQYSLPAGEPLLWFTVHGNQDDYEEFIETNYTNVLNSHKEYLKNTESTPNGDAIIHDYENISLRQIRCYQLPCKSGTITVVEQYYDDDTIPYSAKFYGNYNGIYFSGGCKDSFLNTYGEQYQQILQSLEIVTVSAP